MQAHKSKCVFVYFTSAASPACPTAHARALSLRQFPEAVKSPKCQPVGHERRNQTDLVFSFIFSSCSVFAHKQEPVNPDCFYVLLSLQCVCLLGHCRRPQLEKDRQGGVSELEKKRPIDAEESEKKKQRIKLDKRCSNSRSARSPFLFSC